MVSLSITLLVFISFINYSFSDNYVVNNRRFPDEFKFGVATSAVQIEGGWNADGKGENIWDHMTHTHPEFVKDRTNADVTCNSYEFYKDDVALLKELGVDHYRLSLSWTRILPNGTADYINKAGVKYYKNLFKLLKENNIEPLVTIFHWDTPQVFEDHNGWLNESIIQHFIDYAEVCFKEFGDDVKMWATFNEPKQTCLGGYGYGYEPPGLKLDGRLDYICGHNVLRAHAGVWHLYDDKYRSTQLGNVAIVIDTSYYQPLSDSPDDVKAQQTAFDFDFGWFADPIYLGDYPETMKRRIAFRSKGQGLKKSRLPEFTTEEIEYIKGTSDFFALNTYTTNTVRAIPEPPITAETSRWSDMSIETGIDSSWPNSTMGWGVVPWGINKLLKYIKYRYNNPTIIVTENGYSDNGTLDDDSRVDYIRSYLSNIRDAMESDNVKVIGYTVWSSMDNFEWTEGITQKFGLYHVDFDSPNKTRTPKKSAKFYANVIKTHCLVNPCFD